MRVLVTGGAGFIGSHVAGALARRGDRVRILDDLSTGSRENLASIPGHELVLGDVRDRDAVRRAVTGVEVVFHLAAQVSVTRSVEDPALTYDVNTLCTVHLLEACRAEGARRVVFSSSCAVYGDSPVLPKTESLLPEPLTPYASSKLMGEHLVSMYHRIHGLGTVSLRYFNVYGPRQDPSSDYAAVIPKFVARMRGGERPVIFGDGRQTRDFVCVRDVVEANLAAARTADASGQAVNVGSGRSVDLVGLVAILNGALGTSLEPVHEPPRAGDIRDSRASVDLAASVLGWRPTLGLGEGIAWTLGSA